MERSYDMVIIGGGPGGYSAALYAARAGMTVLVLEKLSAGGQMALTTQIDNYPGFQEGIDGFTLGENMQQQAERFGAVTELAEVTKVVPEGEQKKVHTTEGVFYGRTLVLATGANPRELGLTGEKELVGKGVNYCAACDGMFYKGKDVVVVGGGNTAAADALLLSRVAKSVTVVHRRDTLRAEKISHQALESADNVTFVWNSTVSQLLYGDKLTAVVVENKHTGEQRQIPCDGLFVSIGRKPATGLVQGQLQLDEAGYIVADESTQTSVPGVFAVGDIRTKSVRQIVTAVADGAVAAHYAQEYLASREENR